MVLERRRAARRAGDLYEGSADARLRGRIRCDRALQSVRLQGGVAIASTATTDCADVLVSGVNGGGNVGVLKYAMVRTSVTATALPPKRLAIVSTGAGTLAQPAAGN